MKLREALSLFLGEYKPSTRRAYEGCILPLITEIGPGRETVLVTPAELLAYVQDIRKCPWAEATIQKHIKSIKRFFNWLVDIGELEKSPGQVLRQKRLDRKSNKDKAATDQELETMLKMAYGHPRNYALIRFIADTGCRAGGAAALRIKKLNLKKLTAEVIEKGDKERTVWFSEVTAIALQRWLDSRKEWAKKSPYVFCSSAGEPLTSAAVSQIIRRYCKNANIRSLGSHSLRHRTGHKLADSGVPVTVAAVVLGHTDSRITADFYYPHDDERAEKAVRSIHLALDW